jgi:hypothetical protein
VEGALERIAEDDGEDGLRDVWEDGDDDRDFVLEALETAI